MYNNDEPTKVLFITGYNTRNTNTFDHLNTYLENGILKTRGNKVSSISYFYFGEEESSEQIISRLVTTYNNDKYNAIIAHSTGNLLLSYAYVLFDKKPVKVVCMMPYIALGDFKQKLLYNVPAFICNWLYLPKFIVLPLSTRRTEYSFNDILSSFKLMNLSHIKDLTDNINDYAFEQFCNICKDENTILVSGRDDKLAIIPDDKLETLKNICQERHIILNCRHQPFNDQYDTRQLTYETVFSALELFYNSF